MYTHEDVETFTVLFLRCFSSQSRKDLCNDILWLSSVLFVVVELSSKGGRYKNLTIFQ